MIGFPTFARLRAPPEQSQSSNTPVSVDSNSETSQKVLFGYILSKQHLFCGIWCCYKTKLLGKCC